MVGTLGIEVLEKSVNEVVSDSWFKLIDTIGEMVLNPNSWKYTRCPIEAYFLCEGRATFADSIYILHMCYSKQELK